MATRTRIMYIEPKSDSVLGGTARIGRVTYSKSGRTLYYQDCEFFTAEGFKSNYMDQSHHEYWISGPKKNGGDRLYSGMVEIDEDVREEYWTEIRNMPEKKTTKKFHCAGKYSK
jgi:hypothetical protein